MRDSRVAIEAIITAIFSSVSRSRTNYGSMGGVNVRLVQLYSLKYASIVFITDYSVENFSLCVTEGYMR